MSRFDDMERDSKAIIDLLSKVKAATKVEICCKLNMSEARCRYVLSILRRTHPNISSMKGLCYVWLDEPDSLDTGMRDGTKGKLDEIYDHIKRTRHTTISGIAQSLNMSRSTVGNYMTYLKSMDTNISLVQASGTHYSEFPGTQHSEYLLCDVRNKILGVLSKDRPMYVKDITGLIGYSAASTSRYVNILSNKGEINRTREGACVLPSDIPVKNMTAPMVVAYSYLTEHGKIDTEDLARLIHKHRGHNSRILNDLADTRNDIELKVVNNKVTLYLKREVE